jgi:ABC-type uncharacterized transport system auxiliary subunit
MKGHKRTASAAAQLLKALLFVVLMSAGLGGCSSLLESDAPPLSEWWLEPVTPARPVDRGEETLVLNLAVVPGLDSDRILNLGPQARLNHYAGAHWPEHLPEVLGSVLARSFEQGGWRAVRLGDRARGEDECLLNLETRAFYGRVNRENITQRVEVRFDGSLECGSTQRTVSSRQDMAVAENRMGTIVAAFQTALGESVEDLTAAMAP